MKFVILVILFTLSPFQLGCCIQDVSSVERKIAQNFPSIDEFNPYGLTRTDFIRYAATDLTIQERLNKIESNEIDGNIITYIEITLLQAREHVASVIMRAQEFRNHIHLVLSDLLANAEYDSKAKSPGDSDGISLDELKIIQEQIRKISVLSANKADLLQFMEKGGLDNFVNSFTEGGLKILPQASKTLIEGIVKAYKDKIEGYQPELSENGKLKVYLGVATSVSADAPAKPTLEVSSPAIVDEFDKPQETKLSLSDAVGVDKRLGKSKAKTPPASPVRRLSPFLSSQFQELIQQTQERIQQTPSPRRGSRFYLDGKGGTNERVPTGNASKSRQNGFNRPLSPYDNNGDSYSDSVEQRKRQKQAFLESQQSKLKHVNQEARDAAMRSQIKVSGER